MGQEITVEELRAMLLDKELLKDLPLSKAMIDFMVRLIQNQEDPELEL